MLARDPTWEFKDVRVTAPTLEYGHRISDLINGCAAAGLVVDGFWETTPGEISTKVPLRALSHEALLADRHDLEPGSDDALERYLPAFIEWRAPRRGDFLEKLNVSDRTQGAIYADVTVSRHRRACDIRVARLGKEGTDEDSESDRPGDPFP